MNKSASEEKSRPKNPLSAYACFIQVIREEHRKKHPNEHVDFGEFSRKCAEKWRSMSDNEKRRFEDMAAADRERYNHEKSELAPRLSTPQKRKAARDPNKPKRAWSAFFFFCDEHRPVVREQHPDWRFGDVAKELGRLWESCTDKVKYENMASEAKLKYEEEMAKYRIGAFAAKQLPIGGHSVSSDAPGTTSSSSNMAAQSAGSLLMSPTGQTLQSQGQTMASGTLLSQPVTTMYSSMQPQQPTHQQPQYIVLPSQPHNFIVQPTPQGNFLGSTAAQSTPLHMMANPYATLQPKTNAGMTLVSQHVAIPTQPVQGFMTQAPHQQSAPGMFTYAPSSLPSGAMSMASVQQARQLPTANYMDLPASAELT